MWCELQCARVHCQLCYIPESRLTHLIYIHCDRKGLVEKCQRNQKKSLSGRVKMNHKQVRLCVSITPQSVNTNDMNMIIKTVYMITTVINWFLTEVVIYYIVIFLRSPLVFDRSEFMVVRSLIFHCHCIILSSWYNLRPYSLFDPCFNCASFKCNYSGCFKI